MKKQIVAVVGLIENDEGRIYMQKRNDPGLPAEHGKWEFPGGGVEFGESLQEALTRECREEAGCEVEIGKLIPHIIVNRARDKGHECQVFVVCFICKVKTGTPRPTNEEASDAGWFTKEEALKLDSLRGIDKFIERLEEA